MYNNPMPYNNFFPYQNNNLLKRGLGLSFFKTINWSNILNNTQKTLNVINQTIPLYYQIKPVFSNAKTMFRMVNAIKNDNNDIESTKKEPSTGPVFFL